MNSEGYTKLQASILTSTIWIENDQTVRLWITLLALCDKRGFVSGTAPGLASVARLSMDDCRAALVKFLAPDPDSRTKQHEGRRIQEVDGGWLVLNFHKYREKGTHEVASLATAGYVYYAELRDMIKIGFSKNPWARMADLRVTAPQIKLLAAELGSLETEKERHDQFANERIEGEWFKATEQLLAFIQSLPKSKTTVATRKTTVWNRSPTVATKAEAEAEAEAEAVLSSDKGTPTKLNQAPKKRRTPGQWSTVKRFERLLGDQWRNDSGKWINRIKTEDGKTVRVLVEVENAVKEGRITSTPAQYAEQIWKEFK